jgi:hypothetical protein
VGRLPDTELKTTQVAFVDKIQNVPYTDLPIMLEGIRRSVLERGYILILPEDLGDHNGLSNVDETRSFVKRNIALEGSENRRYLNFQPHPNDYDFDASWSRAYLSLPSVAVLPFSETAELKLQPGELCEPWQSENFDLEKLLEPAMSLKNSELLEERLRYLPTMTALRKAGIPVDPDFEKVIDGWLKNPAEPFQLRKQILVHKWDVTEFEPLLENLKHFTFNEQVQILQNFLDTPRIREHFLSTEFQAEAPRAIIQYRKNKKLKNALIQVWLKPIGGKILTQHLLDFVLQDEDVSDTLSTELLTGIAKFEYSSSNVSDINDFLQFISTSKMGTALQTNLTLEFLSHLVRNQKTDLSLGRLFTMNLNSEIKFEFDWLNQLLVLSEKQTTPGFPILKALKDFQNFRDDHREFVEPKQAAQFWLKSTATEPDLKSRFLLANLGNLNDSFEFFTESLSEQEVKGVMAELDRRFFFKLFAKRLLQRLDVIGSDFFNIFTNRVKLESFEFVPIHVPVGGIKFKLGSPHSDLDRASNEIYEDATLTQSFEIQKTPMTIFQQAILMDSIRSLLNRDVNQPTGFISPHQAQELIYQLNDSQSEFEYRLPTEAEWEYAARGGTHSIYSFGEDSSELANHGWYLGNSRNAIHSVAELTPNPLGLFDVHGNIREMTQSTVADNGHTTPERDPTDRLINSVFIAKGCSYVDQAPKCRTAARKMIDGRNIERLVGIRLVRTRLAH